MAVSLVRTTYGAGEFLQPASGQAAWTADGRWPAADAFDQLDIPEEIPEPASGEMRVDLSNALPPSASSLAPAELDAVLGGGFFAGPWRAYRLLRYPPGEPASETSHAIEEVELEPAVEAPRVPLVGLPLAEPNGFPEAEQPTPRRP